MTYHFKHAIEEKKTNEEPSVVFYRITLNNISPQYPIGENEQVRHSQTGFLELAEIKSQHEVDDERVDENSIVFSHLHQFVIIAEDKKTRKKTFQISY